MNKRPPEGVFTASSPCPIQLWRELAYYAESGQGRQYVAKRGAMRRVTKTIDWRIPTRKSLFFLATALAVIAVTAPILAQQVDPFAINKRFRKHSSAGNYSAALEEARTLETAVKSWIDVDRLSYAAALHNLALVCSSQGSMRMLRLYRRAPAIRKKTLGANHPNAAQILNNFANVYQSLGKHADVERLLLRDWRIGKKPSEQTDQIWRRPS